MNLRPLLIALLSAALPCLAGPEAQPSKPVLAYYMPWYAAKPFSADWGWHWTMGHFNPDKINAAGEREIASWYYPLIGPYDSADPAVLEYHVLLMKLAGIDGVIVDWYGSTDYLDYGANNRATAKLFEFTRKAGLKFVICYEDQTIQHLIDGGKISRTNALAHAQSEMLYLQTNFFNDPSYLRLDGRPLLQNFGPQFFHASTNWHKIFSVLAASNRPAFFTEDNRLAAGMGGFNWPPMWMSQMPGTAGVLSDSALKNYLNQFEQKAGTWPAYISSAFPRFHDIYQRAGNRNYWGYLGDRNGGTFRETLQRAMTNNSALVQIVTWNDFGEGTAIEPTKEYGFRDLVILQEFRRQYLDPHFIASTNDLNLALEYYRLQHKLWSNAPVTAQFNLIFADLVSNRTEAARLKLRQISNLK